MQSLGFETINSQLFELYNHNWSALTHRLKNEKADYTFPFLLHVNEQEWLSADLKIMICGQETKGWWEHQSKALQWNVSDIMDFYEKSYHQQKIYSLKGKRHGAFFKGFNFFRRHITQINKTSDVKISFICNNLRKIGRSGRQTGVCPISNQIEREVFPVFSEEVRILKPDLIIFMTGPSCDSDIVFHFPQAIFNQSNTSSTPNALSIINGISPYSLRCYHPAFYKGFNSELKRNMKGILDSFLKQLIMEEAHKS